MCQAECVEAKAADYAAGAESKLKRLSIVLSKFFSPKQGKLQAECIEAAEINYVTRAKSPPKNPESIAFRIFSFVPQGTTSFDRRSTSFRAKREHHCPLAAQNDVATSRK